MTIYDITPPITPGLAVFPGDTKPTREVLLDLERGDHITLSTLHTTVHLGAHLDAPSHYGKGGATMDAQPLELYMGRCQVIHTVTRHGHRVEPDDLTEAIACERVLLRTGTFLDPEDWNDDFAGLSVELVDVLAGAGVRLVGIDTPSVDPSTTKKLIAHRRLFERDIAILEGIMLEEVPAGFYELIALPLALVGFDASPVRAILRGV